MSPFDAAAETHGSISTPRGARKVAVGEEEACSSPSFSTSMTSTGYDDMCSTSPGTVTFQEEDQYRMIPSRDSLSEEEIAAVWMTPEDFQRIARHCRKVIMIMDSNPTKKYRARGLECHTRQGITAKHLHRSNAIQTVLSEQFCGSSWEIIAQAYNAASAVSQVKAYMVALRDRKETDSQ